MKPEPKKNAPEDIGRKRGPDTERKIQPAEHGVGGGKGIPNALIKRALGRGRTKKGSVFFHRGKEGSTAPYADLEDTAPLKKGLRKVQKKSEAGKKK